MSLPGLIIEYLITGSVALVWLYPILRDLKDRVGLQATDSSYLPVLLLGLYVIGLFLDILAFYPLRPIKLVVRRFASKRYGFSAEKKPGTQVSRAVRFALYAPELAKEVEMRSSRDRVARGVLVNMIVATCRVLTLQLGLSLIAISLVAWVSCEYLSYTYEIQAERALNEKLELDSMKSDRTA